jgi:hypothetical protein
MFRDDNVMRFDEQDDFYDFFPCLNESYFDNIEPMHYGTKTDEFMNQLKTLRSQYKFMFVIARYVRDCYWKGKYIHNKLNGWDCLILLSDDVFIWDKIRQEMKQVFQIGNDNYVTYEWV